MKLCRDCKQLKILKMFYKSKTTRDGLRPECNQCHYAQGIVSARKSSLKRNYGITPLDYERMYLKQAGACAICKRQNLDGLKKRLHVDHDHKTDKVRGLLCSNCNMALGAFQDSIEIMHYAEEYLERFLQTPAIQKIKQVS